MIYNQAFGPGEHDFDDVDARAEDDGTLTIVFRDGNGGEVAVLLDVDEVRNLVSWRSLF